MWGSVCVGWHADVHMGVRVSIQGEETECRVYNMRGLWGISDDLDDAFKAMWQKRRYNELLFVVDTCQASTLADR